MDSNHHLRFARRFTSLGALICPVTLSHTASGCHRGDTVAPFWTLLKHPVLGVPRNNGSWTRTNISGVKVRYTYLLCYAATKGEIVTTINWIFTLHRDTVSMFSHRSYKSEHKGATSILLVGAISRHLRAGLVTCNFHPSFRHDSFCLLPTTEAIQLKVRAALGYSSVELVLYPYFYGSSAQEGLLDFPCVFEVSKLRA